MSTVDGAYEVPQRIEFDIQTPGDADGGEAIRRHIAHAHSLGLRPADRGGRRLRIVANGPSAREFLAEATSGYDATMAINGALKLFVDAGIHPTYWIGCDPQARLAEYLTEPPYQTNYLVASKCHPAVFERLKTRSVLLWNVADQPMPAGVETVRVCTSVTLCALQLASRMGFRHVDVYGWDGAYKEGRHHAGDDIGGPAQGAVELNVGGTWNQDTRECEGGVWYTTSPTWALEAQEALNIIPIMEWAGLEVTIHGDSLIKAIQNADK